jgi:hypothetical protein
MKVDLGAISFPTQRAATQFFGRMLYRYRYGDRVGEQDAQYLAMLLALHPECDAKIGCGIAWFEVSLGTFATQCFYVMRSDGTGINFSYHECIRNAARCGNWAQQGEDAA